METWRSRWRKQTHGVLGSFAGATTLHGVPKVIQARSSVVRCIWAGVCLLAFVMFSVQVYKVMYRYYSYPKKVTVEVTSRPVPFPSVTMCNMRVLDGFILNTINRLFLQDPSPIHHLNATESEFIRSYMNITAKYAPLWYKYQDTFPNNFINIFSRTVFSANIPQNVASAAGIQLEEFIVSCHFRDNKCNRSKDLLQFFDPHYYNCFTYNGGHLIDGLLSGGTENGWSTVVYSGSGILDKNVEIRILPGLSESSKQFAANDGVRVVIHPPGTTPFPLFEGFDVPPGVAASFGVRPRKIERIKEPHGNCTDRNPFHKADQGNTYRLISCQKMCLQSYIIDSCGCKGIELPDIPGSDVLTCQHMGDFPDTCMKRVTTECFHHFLNQSANLKCMHSVINNVTEDSSLIDNCTCFPPCDEIHYDISYSLSKWPAAGFRADIAQFNIFYVDIFKERFKKSKANNMISSYFTDGNREETMKDFARISVYVADTNMMVTQELEDYTSIQMLSDIGGQLGLWVGISVITLAEVIELLFNLFWLAASKRQRNHRHDIGVLDDQMTVRREERNLDLTNYGVGAVSQNETTMVGEMKAMEDRIMAKIKVMEERWLRERGSTD